MNRPLPLILITVLLGVSACAYAAQPPSRSNEAAQPMELPPPELHDKGISEAPQPQTEDEDPLQPAMPDTRMVRDKASRDKHRSAEQIRASTEMTRRQEGNDTIEEYREKGRLRMIRVIPQNGPEQIYMDANGDGRLDRDPRDGPVAPVYFKLYEWN
jgi:hypothetical protein